MLSLSGGRIAIFCTLHGPLSLLHVTHLKMKLLHNNYPISSKSHSPFCKVPTLILCLLMKVMLGGQTLLLHCSQMSVWVFLKQWITLINLAPKHWDPRCTETTVDNVVTCICISESCVHLLAETGILAQWTRWYPSNELAASQCVVRQMLYKFPFVSTRYSI